MALANYPDFVEAHQGLASVLIERQQAEESSPYLHQATDLDKENEVS